MEPAHAVSSAEPVARRAGFCAITDEVIREIPRAAADAAARLYARLARGGGLCRELANLPAWLRVSSALSRERWLETWLEHCRLRLAGARILKQLGVTLVQGSTHSSEAPTGV